MLYCSIKSFALCIYSIFMNISYDFDSGVGVSYPRLVVICPHVVRLEDKRLK